MSKSPPSSNQQRAIVFFDGVCNLCNASVQFVLKRDKKDSFAFSALQSERARKLFADKPYLVDAPASILLLENGKLYTESTAALKIAKKLGGGWPAFYYIFIIVPPFIRDGIYRFVASNRYKWFGRQDSCMLPRPEWKHKFLD